MKKYIYMAVAAIAALSSCSNDNEIISETEIGNRVLTFSATMEGNATRATLDGNENCALWDANDQININGVRYNAQAAGATTTFKAATSGVGAAGSTFTAYFPASLYDGSTATLPAIQTYTAGKFDMPMYAESTNTTLAFKNLCAVLAVKVTSADIATLKSIKVRSDKKMNGSFTVIDDKAVVGDGGTNEVELVSSEALTLTAEGTIFYIAIPAQAYSYLNIYLSSDGSSYTQAMATKNASGLGTIARNEMFSIDYERNAVQLWASGPMFALYNVGANSETEEGTKMIYSATTQNLWGSNWSTPSQDNLNELMNAADDNFKGSKKVDCELINEGTVIGFKFTGKEGYENNSVFFVGYLASESYDRRDPDDPDSDRVLVKFFDAKYWSNTFITYNKGKRSERTECKYIYLQKIEYDGMPDFCSKFSSSRMDDKNSESLPVRLVLK